MSFGERWTKDDYDRVLRVVTESRSSIARRMDVGELNVAISKAKDPGERRLLQLARNFVELSKGDGNG